MGSAGARQLGEVDESLSKNISIVHQQGVGILELLLHPWLIDR